jgi:hypothetical protein
LLAADDDRVCFPCPVLAISISSKGLFA